MTSNTNVLENIASKSNLEVHTTRPLSQEQIAQYYEDGFVIVRGFFDPEELEPVRKDCEADPNIKGAQIEFGDNRGEINQIAFWNDLGDSLLGVIPRLARMVDAAEALLGGECYHWHSKLVQKQPHSLGRFEWHQDYGGWYYDGCLFPDILSCAIGVNDHTSENGCLQFIKKSHLLGRLDLVRVGGDSTWCDPERMEKILEKLEVVYCELQAGDVVFFHANMIHASGGNQTDQTRINLITHYNLMSNKPFEREGREYRSCHPLKKLPDSTILEGQYKGVFDNHQFLQPEKVLKTLIQYSDETR